MPQQLTPLAVSSIALAATFVAAILGMVLRRRLPPEHLNEDTKDVIKLVMGLIATMAALVLGLLIASAKTSYDTQSDELQRLSAGIVELGGLLTHYGPAADEARKRLGETVGVAAKKLWPQESAAAQKPGPVGAPAEMARAYYESLASLAPTTDAQRLIQKKVLEISSSLRQTRALMLGQLGNSLPWPFLTVLIIWIVALFLGFGLFARINTTVIVVFLTGALAVSSALFLILELNQPYTGLMRISDAPLRNALAEIAK